MIKVKIPDNFISERSYIIEILFKEFLGLNYNIEIVENIQEYQILLPNNKILIIEDDFFSKFKDGHEYLNLKNIPDFITWGNNKFTFESDIPIIYGNEKIIVENNKITCSIDIFASSFFMLTRWEEFVIKEKDEYNRFPEKKSLAIKAMFYKRPIVNEYCEMLWKMLMQLGYKAKRIDRKYKTIITHDVDFFARYDSFKKYVRALAGDLFLRKNVFLPLKTTCDYFAIK